MDVSPQNNANSIVLQGKDLEALSDDPDELSSELQALAGPSAGPNGGQIYIDGFTAGQLPPKASIREIRINQNPFSSEYDKLGYGRIEIFTKPGTDKLHGQLQMLGNASSFNSRNPFETAQDGVSPPGYNSEQYSGNIGGPINKKASFFFNIERRNIGALNVVSATVLDPANNFAIVPESLAVPNPQTRTNLSPRIDYQLTPNNTLTVRYQYFRDVADKRRRGSVQSARKPAAIRSAWSTPCRRRTRRSSAPMQSTNRDSSLFVPTTRARRCRPERRWTLAERSRETAAVASDPPTFRSATNTRTPRF